MNHVLLLNLCGWGERLRHRRAKLQQRQAMREAKAAGWTIAGPEDDLDNDNDNDNDDDEGSGIDLENEHNTWHTPEDAALKQHFPDATAKTAAAASSTNVGRRRHHNSSSTTMSSFAGRLKLFTPEYFEISADGTPRLCTSSPESATAEMGPEEDDEDDDASNAAAADAASSSSSSSVASSNSDDSFLQVLPENAPEESSALSPAVNAMLDRWQHQLNSSSTNRNQSAGDGTNHQHHLHDGPSAEDEPPTVGSCTTMAMKYDCSNTTEEKKERAAVAADPTTTTTTSDQQQELVVVPAEESSRISFPPTDRNEDDDNRDNNNTNEEDDSDSDDDSNDSDGDSVDYGGAETSVWQGVGQSFLSAGSVIGSTSNSSSRRADAVVGATGGRGTTAVATATTTTNPPPMTTSAKNNPLVTTSTDRLVMDNYDHYDDDDDGDDDMAHQGAEVFLYTESKNKYNNNYTTDATTTTTSAIGGAVVSSITTTNKLFDITEAKQHQRDNRMTETARIIQETTAATTDNYEDLEFTPRLDGDDDDDEDLTFTYKSPSANKNNNLNLAEILLSPDNDNNKSNNKPQSQQRDNLMSPLSAMVHPINLDLFQNDNIGHDDNDDDNGRLDQSFASSSIATMDNCDNWSVSSCPVSRRLSDMIPSSSDRSVGSSRTSSSFRSSSIAGGRVRYSLSTGKRSMSKAQRQYSKDFLPKSLLVLPPPTPLLEKEMLPHRTAAPPSARTSNSSKNNNKHNSNNSTLSVLLVDVQQHIFEVIAVDCYYKDDCTVGDVLSKARASATDPALSEQKYISLVYGQQEFAAPMLKIHAAVDFTINPEITTSRPLALAVPEGSNARQVQYIKMILWKNPKMKRWWNVEDPFMPSRMDSITEITVPTSPLSQTTTTITQTTGNNDDGQLLLRKKNQVVVSPNTSSENEEEYDGNVEQVIAPADDDDDHDGGAAAVVPPKEKKSKVSILRRRLDFVKWW
jgi:hypothetical protein